jgi:hypothetical protein
MRVQLPKNQEVERFLQAFNYKKVAEDTDTVTYEGGISVGITRGQLGMTRKEFADYCKRIKVEGGRKSKTSEGFTLRPKRPKIVAIRLSEVEYDLLKRAAKERNLTLTQLLMALVAEEIQRFLKWWSEPEDKTKTAEIG